jgi:hypothetical protein
MAKTIREFFNPTGEQVSPKAGKTGIYYLDDLLDDDPRKICPNCDSVKIAGGPIPHGGGILQYDCKKCGYHYEICPYNRAEED